MAEGKADGIMHAWEDRISREGLEAAVQIWNAMKAIPSCIYVACDGVDSRDEDAEDFFYIKAVLANMQLKTYKKRSAEGTKRAAALGVHGGTTPPLGYQFTDRADGKVNVKGNRAHGPLTPTKDAPKVLAAFEAFAEGAAWFELCGILGITSQGNAASILRNRVYLGEARLSGNPPVPGAHPPIVDDILFDRVQRRLAERKAERPAVQRRASGDKVLALLARGILRCGSCGGALSPARGSSSYRCTRIGCRPQVGIEAKMVEPYVLLQALAHHAMMRPFYEAADVVNDATRSVYEEALMAAEADLAEVEAAEVDMSPAAYGKATTKAEVAVAAARTALMDAERAGGWFGMTSEAVQARLLEADGVVKDGMVPEANSFIREMVSVAVQPLGRGYRTRTLEDVAKRVTVSAIAPGRGADETLVQVGWADLVGA